MSFPKAERMAGHVRLLAGCDGGSWEIRGHMRAIQLAVLATNAFGHRYVVEKARVQGLKGLWLVEREETKS